MHWYATPGQRRGALISPVRYSVQAHARTAAIAPPTAASRQLHAAAHPAMAVRATPTSHAAATGRHGTVAR
jgi:hypothetical protein